MRESEINEKISAYFTPAGFWDTHCRRCHWTFRADGEGCRPDGYCSFVGELPQTADYFHSEDASSRLLEAMPFSYVKKRFRDNWWESAASADHATCEHPDRKTAVALAFCAWAKIEVTP